MRSMRFCYESRGRDRSPLERQGLAELGAENDLVQRLAGSLRKLRFTLLVIELIGRAEVTERDSGSKIVIIRDAQLRASAVAIETRHAVRVKTKCGSLKENMGERLACIMQAI